MHKTAEFTPASNAAAARRDLRTYWLALAGFTASTGAWGATLVYAVAHYA